MLSEVKRKINTIRYHLYVELKKKKKRKEKKLISTEKGGGVMGV